MQIGELSDRTGATVRMLRYYEEHGLIEPQRKPSGYRFFRESDVLRVRYIRCMLASALPTHVVAQALRFLLDEEPDIPELTEERAHLAKVLRGELDALTERIGILERSRGQLERFVTDIEQSIVGPPEPAPCFVDDFGPAVRQGGPVPASSARNAARPNQGNDREILIK